MSKCINRNLKNDRYLRLNPGDCAADDYFNPAPIEYVFLLLYFIPLSYGKAGEERNTCLLVDYDRYIDSEDYEHNREGIWTVPYLSYHVDPNSVKKDKENKRLIGITRPSYYCDCIQLFDDFLKENEDIIASGENQLRFNLGISHWSLRKLDSYLEYKRSYTQFYRKLYFVKEYLVEVKDVLGILNLMDPEGFFGHRYIRLDPNAGPPQNREALEARIPCRFGIIPENVACRVRDSRELRNTQNIVDSTKWGDWRPQGDSHTDPRYMPARPEIQEGKHPDASFHSETGHMPDCSGTKLFISHASEDEAYVNAFVDLLETLQVPEGSIVCTSLAGYGIPNDLPVYGWLKEQFRNYNLHVFYMLSENYYNSPGCLNEMGASWIMNHRESTILLPGFAPENIKGCLAEKNEIWIQLDAAKEAVLFDRLDKMKEILATELNLNKISEIAWERKKKNFLKSVRKITAKKAG